MRKNCKQTKSPWMEDASCVELNHDNFCWSSHVGEKNVPYEINNNSNASLNFINKR